MKSSKITWILMGTVLLLPALSACGGTASENDDKYFMNQDDRRKLRNGTLSGEGGLKLFGGDDAAKGGAASPIGVNSFLWQASLDTLSFLPIASADPFGGVILTDWYEDPDAAGERYKMTVLILSRDLRSDALKVAVHKQIRDETGNFRDQPQNAELNRKIEDTILTQARELRVRSGR